MSERLLNSRQVRQHYGGCSDMTLWRWLRNEKLGFPKPVFINKRRYWREADILAFNSAKAEGSEAA